jgi:hypothetical protein
MNKKEKVAKRMRIIKITIVIISMYPWSVCW